MSGTSADGVDVALTRITPRGNAPPALKLLAHHHAAYPPALRRAVLAAMDAPRTSAAELARLNLRLGEFYAAAVAAATRKSRIEPQLIGCHGQTIYHQPQHASYLGAPLRCTWQLGEPAPLAERLRIPVVSNFRPADLAAGGQGAPLVPILDFALFRSATQHRVLQNLGGIGNLTVLPRACKSTGVFAFDTGPANMVLDACAERLYNKPYDSNGSIASRGSVIVPVVTALLAEPYFLAPPPKTAGREQFGTDYATRLISLCRRRRATDSDILATAAALTAWSIAQAYRYFVEPHLKPTKSPVEFIVSGGGTRNRALMLLLEDALREFSVTLTTSDAHGLPSQAKEAAAFALLAWLTFHGLPGNIPSATGASRSVVLGSITHA
jgi:anhydro-N-acetylmuramic acid kinase